MFADEQLKDFTEYRNMGLGAIIVLFVVLLPDGLAGTVEKHWRNHKSKMRILKGRSQKPGQ